MVTAAATSVAAAKSVNMTHLEEVVLEVITKTSFDGCISDEIQGALPHLSYSSVTARFKSLEERGEIVREGDTRPGVSGRQQYVIRATTYATGVKVAIPKKVKRSAFLAGMMFAIRTVVKASDLAAAKAALAVELRKAAMR